MNPLLFLGGLWRSLWCAGTSDGAGSRPFFGGLRRVALAALMFSCTVPAVAACIPSEVGGVLGSHPSQRVLSGTPITTSADFKLGCATVVLALFAVPTIQAKITTPTTALKLKNTIDSSLTVPYEITPMGGGTFTQGLLFINLSGANAVALLSNNSASIGIKITTQAGANVPAGTYTDVLTVNWNYANICEGVAVGSACVGTVRQGNFDRTITVQLIVVNDCTITAPNIQFGAAPVPSGFATVNQNISLLCTRGMTYTVGLDAGLHSGPARRQMASGTYRLQYDLFKPDLSRWGSVGAARVMGTGMADGLTWHTLPYSARVYTDQPNVPIGSYSDTIKVDVQF